MTSCGENRPGRKGRTRRGPWKRALAHAGVLNGVIGKCCRDLVYEFSYRVFKYYGFYKLLGYLLK